jgi:hypothetical protein
MNYIELLQYIASNDEHILKEDWRCVLTDKRTYRRDINNDYKFYPTTELEMTMIDTTKQPRDIKAMVAANQAKVSK